MDTSTILTAIAIVFLVVTALDWRRHRGGLTPKRRAWLIVAGIFLSVSVYLRLA